MKQSSLHNLKLIEVVPGKKFSTNVLKKLLPDPETALFFAQAYKMKAAQTSNLLATLFPTLDVVQELFGGEHSTELQDYILDLQGQMPWHMTPLDPLQQAFVEKAPQGEILPHLWEQLEVGVAQSISEVADTLVATLDKLPSKEGQMVFRHMNKINKQRPRAAFGTFNARIDHPLQADNLVIFDVSGSMTEKTVRTIVDDVVALSYKANAHLAIVSNNLFYWTPGNYDTQAVLTHAEFGGTRYEQLAPLFQQDWGTVVTIADYDSYWDAREVIAAAPGRVGQVLDISLVDRPTFLAECVGQVATEVRPLLVANTRYPLSN